MEQRFERKGMILISNEKTTKTREFIYTESESGLEAMNPDPEIIMTAVPHPLCN